MRRRIGRDNKKRVYSPARTTRHRMDGMYAYIESQPPDEDVRMLETEKLFEDGRMRGWGWGGGDPLNPPMCNT